MDLRLCSPASLANRLEQQELPVESLLKKAVGQILKAEELALLPKKREAPISFSIQLSVKSEEEKPSADIVVQLNGLSLTYRALFVSAEIVEIKKQKLSRQEELLREKAETEKPAIRILIVDDLPMTHVMLKKMLSSVYQEIRTDSLLEALAIHSAYNGAEACDKVISLQQSKRSYDLIFMNHQMPVMNGIEAILRIREFEKEAHAPAQTILSLSATTEIKESEAAGANEFILKPLILTKMIGEIYFGF